MKKLRIKPFSFRRKRLLTTGFLLCVIFGMTGAGPASAAVLNDYNKPVNGTLSATEWNNLARDLLLKNGGGDRMDGNFSINTATSSSYALNILGNQNVAGDLFAVNVGIGTTATSYKLFVNGAASFNQPVLIGTPTASGHAATKNYVDSVIAGGSGSTVGYWTQSGTNIFNSNTGNVGIGTTAPGSQLTVGGQTNNLASSVASFGKSVSGGEAMALSLVNSAAGTTTNAVSLGFHNGSSWSPTGKISLVQTNSTASRMDFYTYSGSLNNRMSLDSSGNLGIGVSNPNNKLSIVGAPSVGDDVIPALGSNGGKFAILNGGGSGLYGLLQGVNGSGNAFLQSQRVDGTALAYNILLQPNGGNVGIGTIAPTAKLHVNGGGAFTQPVIVGTPTATTHATTKSYVDSLIAGGSGSTVGYWTQSGTNIFNSNTGNVGIGTTTPGAKLDVAGNADNGGFRFSNSSGSVVAQLSYQSGVNAMFGEGEAGRAVLRSEGRNFIIGTNNNLYYLAFGTGLAERMRIDGSGNVGIGTTNPLGKLNIKPDLILADLNAQEVGTISITNNSTGSIAPTITGKTSNSSPGLQFISATQDSGTNADILFNIRENNNSDYSSLNYPGFIFSRYTTPLMTILRNGNVGIGTTVPTYGLHVAGTGYFSQPVIVGTPTASTHATTKNYVDTLIAGGSGSTVGYWSMNGTNIYNSNTGNVGIGTTNPLAKLQIGNLNGSSGGEFWAFNDAATTRFLFGDSSSGGHFGGMSWNKTGAYLGFGHSSSNTSLTDLIINSSGNVGIGTAAPTYGLHVAGTGYFGQPVVVGTPTGSTHATTKSYVDSLIAGGSGSTVGYWTQNGTNIYNSNTGNVGIGTTTPGAKLVATGRILSSDGLSVYPSVGKYAGMYYNTTSNYGSFYAYDYDSATSRSIVLQEFGGNVGIGVVAPAAKLNISEATGVVHGANQGSVIIDHENSGGASSIVFRSKVNRGSDYGYIQYQDTDTVGGAGEIARLILGTSNDVNDSLILMPTGNVGIATMYPAYKLDVYGTGNFTQPVIVGTPTGSTHAATKNYVDSVIAGGSGSTVGYWTQNGTNIYNSNSGNVGIGTTNPGQKLDVNGGINMAVNNYLRSNGNALIGGISNQTEIYGVSNNIRFYGTGGSHYMTIASGNVGIGTTVPVYKLDVAGTGNFTQPVIVGTPTGSTHAATKNYVDSVIAGGSGSTVGYWTQNGTNIYNSNTNNVGIGLATTTAPVAKLEVGGSVKIANTADTCDTAHTGTLRYDPLSGQSYLCDGIRWLNQKNCGLMTDGEGNTYNTVQIGGQCWMAENINIGTMLAAGTTEPNTADAIIEKWCYNNDANNCALYGGLYNWNEAMRGSSVAGAQGICPSGWHMPTDAEWNILEKTILGVIDSPNTQYPCDFSVAGWRRCADDSGTDVGGTYGAGRSLKSVGVGSGVGAGNDLIGFAAKLPGYRDTDGSFYSLGSHFFVWSSTPSGGSNAWFRVLSSSYSSVYRNAYSRAYGFSARCLRD